MKIYIIAFVLCLPLLSTAQVKHDYIWHFSRDREPLPGIQSYRFNFNGAFEIEERDAALEFDNNNISICDVDGNLLFYTNGCAVANGEDQIMPEGDSINAGLFFDTLWDGDCRNGYPGFQDIFIVNDPGNTQGYYILHKPAILELGQPSFNKDIQYSYVDMTLDNGRGDVTIKNEIFYDESEILSGYFTGIQHENQKDWWIVQPRLDTGVYLTFLLDENGIQREADQAIGPNFTERYASASGTARFSPDGTKYAYFNIYDQLILFDFDRATGLLSNAKQATVHDTVMNVAVFSSLEWSSNSRFIYTATTTKLHQIDTDESDLEDGIVLIDTYDGTQNPFANIFFLMAMAPDCRIYMCSTSGNDTYHFINKPNEKGLACDFRQNGLALPLSASFGSMPNHPRWRVDETEKCDPSLTSMFGELVYYRRDLSVYPNPASHRTTIELPEEREGYLRIFDLQGHLFMDQEISQFTDSYNLDLSLYPVGQYQLEYVPKDNQERYIYTAALSVVR